MSPGPRIAELSSRAGRNGDGVLRGVIQRASLAAAQQENRLAATLTDKGYAWDTEA